MRMTLVGLFLVISVASGCLRPSAGLDGTPQIRVANRSEVAFDSVQVVFTYDRLDLDRIPAGGSSAYFRVVEAYRYALVRVFLGDKMLVLQPIDFVGETPLSAGRYTYALSLTPGSGFVSLVLERN